MRRLRGQGALGLFGDSLCSVWPHVGSLEGSEQRWVDRQLGSGMRGLEPMMGKLELTYPVGSGRPSEALEEENGITRSDFQEWDPSTSA